jgi:hypothetical protein
MDLGYKSYLQITVTDATGPKCSLAGLVPWGHMAQQGLLVLAIEFGSRETWRMTAVGLRPMPDANRTVVARSGEVKQARYLVPHSSDVLEPETTLPSDLHTN